MASCPSCGAALKPNAKFCAYCGAGVTGVDLRKAPEPYTPPAPYTPPTRSGSAIPGYNPAAPYGGVRRASPMMVAGMILSLGLMSFGFVIAAEIGAGGAVVCLLLSILAIVLSSVGRARSTAGRGMGTAGLVLGIIATVAYFLITIGMTA